MPSQETATAMASDGSAAGKLSRRSGALVTKTQLLPGYYALLCQANRLLPTDVQHLPAGPQYLVYNERLALLVARHRR